MAVEAKRGCGYRKVGGLYLVSGTLFSSCDRLPFPIHSCPVCGAGVYFSRGMAEVNALKLLGTHEGLKTTAHADGTSTSETIICNDYIRPCIMCDPSDQPAYLLGVGEKYYTPQEYMQEALTMGVSKRIGKSIPKHLEIGKTVVYLTHRKAIDLNEKNEKGENMYQLAIFCAFIPQKIEKLIWQSEATEENLKALEKRGITPVIIPDGDKDHA